MSSQEMTHENNAAERFAEMLGKTFHAGSSPESEMLNIIAKFSLQLTGRQQYRILQYISLAHDEDVPQKTREHILVMLNHYMKYKKHHDTLPIMVRLADAMSLRKFMNGIDGKVNKMQ